jgi:hypothetical protein
MTRGKKEKGNANCLESTLDYREYKCDYCVKLSLQNFY